MRSWILGGRRATAPLALAVALVAGGAWPAGATSLKDALIATYLTNPQLDAARARLQQADELLPQALAGWRPSFFVDSGLEVSRGEINAAVSPSRPGDRFEQGWEDANRTGRSIGLSARQNLYAGGSTVAATSRAENLVRAESARLMATEQNTLLDAVNAYTAAWRDQAVLELALNNEQRLQRQLEATRDRFEVGEVARTDVAQAEARLSRARADIEQAKADLAASRALYLRVIGEEPQALEDPATLKELPRTLADAQALAAGNPEITAATFDLYAARDAVDIAFADLLPSLDVEGRLDDAIQPTTNVHRSRSASVGFQLSIPLYQGGAEYARVRQNRQAASESRDNLETAHRSAQELVSSSYERLLAASAAIDAFRAEVRANQVALEGVQQEATVGARTVLDVLDAEQELFTSQVNLVRARREEIVASYQLKLAVGELTVAGLELPVQPFDTNAYYERTRTRLFGVSD
jgi:TolC family type I secretion outer membrane protein